MKAGIHIRASVLATVIVVAVVMLLSVLALISLWEADFLLFSRTNYLRLQRANIESAYTLYCKYPELIADEGDSALILYDSLPSSAMITERKPWGLYEVVSITSPCGKVHQSRIMGLAKPSNDKVSLWYRNNNSSLTLTGNTNIQGRALLPRNGVIYGQMQSVFFSGTKLASGNIKVSDTQIPEPDISARKQVEKLFNLCEPTSAEDLTDSVTLPFYGNASMVMGTGDGMFSGCFYNGNLILTGGELHIDSSCELHDVIIVARNVTIGDGFSGSLQVFAGDSVIVGDKVILGYPSGIYSRNYASLGEHSQVNGYMIVDHDGNVDIKNPNYSKARTSRLRGLLYVKGIAQLQGIVTGSAYIDEAAYYSPHGYYRNMIYDASILENDEVVYPLWLDTEGNRKEAKWVN